MTALKEPRRVTVVSGGAKTFEYFKELLPRSDFKIDCCRSVSEARSSVSQSPPDIIIIDAPLPDEFGVEFAKDISGLSIGIMLLVKAELYDKVSFDVEDQGILVVSKPNSRQMFYNSVKILSALSIRLRRMENKNRSLQEKMTDIRIVNRAKWLLIEKMGMSERDAHYFIEKRAMDGRVSRREIAESIIRTYDT